MLGGDITKESERNANRGVEGEHERLKEMYGEREYHFRIDPVNETTPHLPHCDFCAVDQSGESIGERRDRRQKENAQDAEKFLEAMQRVPHAKFARLETGS